MDFNKTIKGLWPFTLSEPLKPEKEEYDNLVKQMVAIIKHQRSLYRKEIADWKKARAWALDPEQPRRKMLIDLYEDIMTDAFIWGRWDTRRLRISNKGIAIINKNEEIDKDKTDMLEKMWFNKFIKDALDSKAFGYTLLYVDQLNPDGTIKAMNHVYRDHIVPETKEILKFSTDIAGTRFDEPPVSDWCVWIDSGNLGLLDMAAPLWIFKKHSWQNWDEFEEKFGLPIRTVKTAQTDPRVLREIDSFLKDLGTSAWGRFPANTEIDIKESSSRDSYNVFNEKRKACNEELATLIDGHFETAKDTGSRAKAGSIIESTQKLITLDDETFVKYLMNEKVLPFLREMGYPFSEDDRFIWNENEQQSPKDRLDIFKGVKELGYKVKKEQIETELDVEIEVDTSPPAPPPGSPKDFITGFKLPHASCGHGAVPDTYRMIFDITNTTIEPDEEKLLKQLYASGGNTDWSYNEFKKSHSKLIDGLKGYGQIDFDFESSDHLTVQMMRSNIHRFGTDKTQAQIFQLNQIIKSPEVNTFGKFRERALKVFPNYNERWLETEFDQAQATSQMAARQKEMMNNQDIAPYWRLVAVLDDGTTLICRSLDDKVFRKDDADAWRFLPPNHWKCRSDAEDVLEDYEGEVSTMADAVGADPDGFERMQRSGHDVNWGDEKAVFSNTQGYLSKFDLGEIDTFNAFDYRTFDLKSRANMTNLPDMPAIGRIRRFTDRSGDYRFPDPEGMPVWMERDQVSGPLLRAADDAIGNADEIYWFRAGDAEVKSYFRHYKQGTVHTLVDYNATQKATVQSMELISDPDNARRGLLIYSPVEKIAYNKAKYNSLPAEELKIDFNEKTGAFISRNKNHGKSELKNNLYTAKKMQESGFSSQLLPNPPNIKSGDALVNGVNWEFKLLSNYSNLSNRVHQAIREGSKQSKNILLHIDHQYTVREIVEGISTAVRRDSNKRIQFIAIAFNDNRVFFFSRKQIETGEFRRILN